MLAAHPEIAMLPETGFVRRYCCARQPRDSDAEGLQEADHRLARLSAECWEAAVRSAGGAPADAGHGERGNRDLRAGYAELYRALLSPQVAAAQAGRKPDAVRFTADKDPRLLEYLPVLNALFPHSHVVHIVRDPRDVLLSKQHAEWSGHRNWRANLAAGRFQLDLADRYAKSRYGWRYHVVRYEDLIAAPERTLRRLVHSLDLDYREEMLAFSREAERLTSTSDAAWKQETAGPLLASNSGKWKNGLRPGQVRAVETVMARWFRRYGYSGSERVGPFRKALWRLLYGFASRLYTLKRGRQLRGLERELHG
jgi:hypothetical protein